MDGAKALAVALGAIFRAGSLNLPTEGTRFNEIGRLGVAKIVALDVEWNLSLRPVGAPLCAIMQNEHKLKRETLREA